MGALSRHAKKKERSELRGEQEKTVEVRERKLTEVD